MDRAQRRVLRPKGRWATRSIRRGTVRFFGTTYRCTPDTHWPVVTADAAAALSLTERTHVEVAYDGRLDGMRGMFYSYSNLGATPGGPVDRCVFLHSIIDAEWPGPECIDGVFRFQSWEPVNG